MQALAAGATPTDTFNVISSDGSDNVDVVITITGANDAATITGDTSGAVGEDGTLATAGDLNVADTDAGEDQVAPQTNVVGTYGVFNVTVDGGWTYSLSNADAVVQAAKS